MKVAFSYRDVEPIEIPLKNLVGIYQPEELKGAEGEDMVIKDGFTHPLDSPPICELAKKVKRVLILVDDNTRTTPLKLILPYLFKELSSAGVTSKDIRILIALGTHRPMTLEEKVEKFGEEVLSNYEVIDHKWSDENSLEFIGETPGGIKIKVNKMLKEADLIIGVGHIVPHRVSGYSGGGKIVMPGVTGEETTGGTHWLSAQYEGKEIMGKIDNPVREEINSILKQARLKAIVNAIQDRHLKLAKLVVGDPIKAFREGALVSGKIFGVKIDALADIVIAESYPADIEMWQASKGIYSADLAVKEGGIIILITPCPEGIAREHPEVERLGYRPYREVSEMVEEGRIKDLTVAAHLVHVGRVIKEKASCILVTKGISDEIAKRVGFQVAKTPEEALARVFDIKGKNASVAVLKHGGEILPLI